MRIIERVIDEARHQLRMAKKPLYRHTIRLYEQGGFVLVRAFPEDSPQRNAGELLGNLIQEETVQKIQALSPGTPLQYTGYLGQEEKFFAEGTKK